jgi:ribosomal protein L19
MAELFESRASLRIQGNPLDPDEITLLLGGSPTLARKKDDRFISKSGRERVAKTGQWHITANCRIPGDLDAQVEEILGGLSQDLEIWAGLAKTYRMDLFCGFFMKESGEGIVVSPKTLKELGDRGIELQLDMYSPTIEELQIEDEDAKRSAEQEVAPK